MTSRKERRIAREVKAAIKEDRRKMREQYGSAPFIYDNLVDEDEADEEFQDTLDEMLP